MPPGLARYAPPTGRGRNPDPVGGEGRRDFSLVPTERTIPAGDIEERLRTMQPSIQYFLQTSLQAAFTTSRDKIIQCIANKLEDRITGFERALATRFDTLETRVARTEAT
eukprot:2038164-Amphidinium_carterae.2